MHDIRAIRTDPAAFDAAMARRGLPPVIARIAGARHRPPRRADRAAGQAGPPQRAVAGDRPGQARRRRHRRPRSRGHRLARRDGSLEKQVPDLDTRIRRILEALPNILDPSSPTAPTSRQRRPEAAWATPRDLNFAPKQHFELGEALGMMDFATAAKLAGARFTVLRGPLARMERALGQFMLDLHTPITATWKPSSRRWSTRPPPTAPATCRNSRTTCSRPPTAAT